MSNEINKICLNGASFRTDVALGVKSFVLGNCIKDFNSEKVIDVYNCRDKDKVFGALSELYFCETLKRNSLSFECDLSNRRKGIKELQCSGECISFKQLYNIVTGLVGKMRQSEITTLQKCSTAGEGVKPIIFFVHNFSEANAEALQYFNLILDEIKLHAGFFKVVLLLTDGELEYTSFKVLL